MTGDRDPGPPPGGPLAGLRVLDLTRVLAGPYATMILADLGATVVKVERPGTGDDARHIGPFVDGISAYFASVNRGKRSIALDLREPADREIFERLVGWADVLVENFRPGTMARLGYGYEDLAPAHPRLVYASVSGFGHTGPLAGRPAYDVIAQGMGGIMSITGHPDGPPTRVGTSIGDLTAGLFAVIGILAAVAERDRTGRGTFVDVAMLDAQVAILENAVARWAATGVAPGRVGNRHPSITPFGAFATADGHLVLAAGNDTLFATLCEALGRPGLATDPRYRTNRDRTAHVDSLTGEIESVLRTAPTATWLERLERAGIPCGPVNDVAALAATEQVSARRMLVRSPVGERWLTMAGNPVKLAGHPDPEVRPPAPTLDGDRRWVLGLIGADEDGDG